MIDPFTSALELARMIRQREVSPVEVTQLYLDRIDKHNPELNAFVTVIGDRALAEARSAEQEVAKDGDLPPFHGVPLAVKDLTETAGVRTTYSSRAFADFVPENDAYVVRRLKEAGFIILGKSNASEFGTFPVTESELNGDCLNPWDTSRTPGGSSGGSGAAVAAGLAPAGQGTDGGGSIRIPASCCGIFGLKPARGRISRGPYLGEYWGGYSTDGPLTRTVADAAALLDVMAGYETGDPYWAPPPERPFAQEAGRDPGKMRVGLFTKSLTGVEIDPVVVDAANDAARLLESLGHEVEEVSADWIDPDLTSHFIKVVQTSTAYHPCDLALIEPANRALAEAGEMTSSLTYVKALESLRATARRELALWADIDVMLTPTLAMPPVPIGWMFEEDDPWMQLLRAGMFVPFTPLANFSGQPAVSLPLYWSADGLPIGVQLIGDAAGEAALFRLSAQLEAARPWADRHPPGF
jgi:amidase